MVCNQCCDHVRSLIVKLKPFEGSLCKVSTDGIVIIKMINTILIRCASLWLGNIMKQHCETKNRIRGNRFNSVNCMVTYRINMMRVILWSFHHTIKLWKKNTCKASLISSANHFRMTGNQKLHQFCLNTFRTYIFKKCMLGLNCRFSIFFNLKI